MNSRIKELLSNTFLFTIANMGSKILVFLMVPLYTAVLSTEEYGISDLVHTTAMMLYPVLTGMVAEAVLRFCFLQEVDKKDVFSIGLRLSLMGTFICSIVSVGIYFIPMFKSLGVYTFFIPVFFFNQSIIQLFHKFARGTDKVKVSAFAGLISTIATILLNLFFLLVLKLGVFGYLLAYSLADIIAILYMSYKCHARFFWTYKRNITLRAEMLKYSFPLVPNQISWWALSNINRYLMLAWLGVASVGVYSATLRVPSILTVFSDIFAQAWLLSALKNYGSDESKAFIRAMHGRYFSALIIATALIILLSEPLAAFLLSGEFSSYWYLLPFLFISVFWGALVGFLGSIFSAERKNKMQFVSTMVGAIVSILITLVFLKVFGVIIVAITTMAGYFVIWLIRRIAVNKYIDVGVGTVYSIVQGVVLLLEAIFVSKEQYLYAVVCILVLMILNYKNMLEIIRFGYDNLVVIIKSKIIKNG